MGYDDRALTMIRNAITEEFNKMFSKSNIIIQQGNKLHIITSTSSNIPHESILLTYDVRNNSAEFFLINTFINDILTDSKPGIGVDVKFKYYNDELCEIFQPLIEKRLSLNLTRVIFTEGYYEISDTVVIDKIFTNINDALTHIKRGNE